MKKNYFLVALLALAFTSVNAQFTDDMESYTPGQPIYQDWWTDWGCGGTCAILSSADQAYDGSQSGYVSDDNAMDAVLDLGNKIFGEWGLDFWMYVVPGKEAYMNFQGTVPIGSGTFPVGNIFFNEASGDPGNGYIDFSTGDTSVHRTFSYPEGEWFRVTTNFDFTSGAGSSTFHMYINGGTPFVEMGHPFASWDGTAWDYSDTQSLGGVDFYSISTNNQYYVDAFTYQDSFVDPNASSVSDFAAKGFSAYPNPVSDKLNIQAKERINSVVIYNVLGQQVYNAQVDALSSTIDMSRMASGAYFVNVNINGTEGTVKVIK